MLSSGKGNCSDFPFRRPVFEKRLVVGKLAIFRGDTFEVQHFVSLPVAGLGEFEVAGADAARERSKARVSPFVASQILVAAE